MSHRINKPHPKLRRKVTRYKGKETAYAVVRLNGKDFTLGRFESEEATLNYDRLIGIWLKNGRQLSSIEAKEFLGQKKTKSDCESLTITKICIDYVRDREQKYKSANELDTLKRVLREFRSRFGETEAELFSESNFQAFRRHLITFGIQPKSPDQKPKTLSRYVVNKYCRHIVRLFEFASETSNAIPKQIYQSIAAVKPLKPKDRVAPETRPIRLVEESIVELTIQKLHPIIADMIRLQLLTGMRPGEVCMIRPGDIIQGEDAWAFYPTSHKTAHQGSDRKIYFGPDAQKILKKYMDRPKKRNCFSPQDRLADRQKKATVAGKKVQDLYTTRTYRQAIWRGCDKAEIERWSPNRLRKTAATKIRKLGGLDAAQAVLGHKHRSTTERFYAELENSLAVSIMAEMG